MVLIDESVKIQEIWSENHKVDYQVFQLFSSNFLLSGILVLFPQGLFDQMKVIINRLNMIMLNLQ